MANSQPTALDRLHRPLAQKFAVELARAVVAIQADAETQALYDELPPPFHRQLSYVWT